MARLSAKGSAKDWRAYYRYTAGRPPRELLLQALNHLEWERRSRRGLTAVEIGFGAGTDTLELLRRGWSVVAMDQQEVAARFLERRVPPRWRPRLTTLIAPMERFEVPPADLVYASFSLPFCEPDQFPALWSSIRRSVRPRGHFVGQLFGDEDEWHRDADKNFHNLADVKRLARGWKAEMLRETREDGMAFNGPKHWHFFDLILEKPGRRHR